MSIEKPGESGIENIYGAFKDATSKNQFEEKTNGELAELLLVYGDELDKILDEFEKKNQEYKNTMELVEDLLGDLKNGDDIEEEYETQSDKIDKIFKERQIQVARMQELNELIESIQKEKTEKERRLFS